MTISAIIMMVIGLGITWGGAAVCIKRAWINNRTLSSIQKNAGSYRVLYIH